MAKLGELYKITSGGTPSRNHSEYYEDGTIPWVKTGDLKDKYLFETDEKISQLGLENSSARIYLKNTVLLAMYGATIGATSILKIDAATNQACAAFSPREDTLPEYLYAFLESQKDKFIKDAVGGAQPNLSAGYLKTIEFKLPSLEQQTRITRNLSKIDELLLLRKQQIAKLDELVKARFVEMFGEPMSNPMGWKRVRFDSISENLDSKRVPVAESDRKDGIYPYYGASGIVDWINDYIFDEDILLVSEDGANLLMRSAPIAFSVSGKSWVNNHAHVVRFHDFATQKFIEIYFSLIDISEYITGTAQPKLNQAKLNAMLFCWPPLALQNQFATFVERVDQQKQTVQQSLEKLELMKKALMQEYFG
ncbi:restriction endonuclease subunit S [Faecalibacterium prausnitzii]|uniref:restriction endonuclease subunit S n=1 Tax=Faecalibacterium prausnitzii TaxID=853 RepID=UPI003C2BE06B